MKVDWQYEQEEELEAVHFTFGLGKDYFLCSSGGNTNTYLYLGGLVVRKRIDEDAGVSRSFDVIVSLVP